MQHAILEDTRSRTLAVSARWAACSRLAIIVKSIMVHRGIIFSCSVKCRSVKSDLRIFEAITDPSDINKDMGNIKMLLLNVDLS